MNTTVARQIYDFDVIQKIECAMLCDNNSLTNTQLLHKLVRYKQYGSQVEFIFYFCLRAMHIPQISIFCFT